MNDKEFTLSAVSPNVKDWAGSYGAMKTYRVKFAEAGDEVFELNKKPESPAPQKGEVLFGHFEDSKNPEFPTRKFKTAPKQFGGKFTSRDDASIKAQFAIKAAVQLASAWELKELGDIEETAKELFGMVERVKGAPQEKDKFEFTKKEDKEEIIDLGLDDKEEINLSDIPFS